MDGQQYIPTQELPPIAPVITYEVPQISQQVAEVSRFEPYSISAALEQMFQEAEQAGDDQTYWREVYEDQAYPKDTEAFRMYMTEVHRELKASDAVTELRQAAKEGKEITKTMVERVFRVYEDIVGRAARILKSKLSSGQLSALKQAGRNNLDWSYRGLLVERLTQPEEAQARYSLEDFFLILNPKARKVEYMERQEVLKTLNHSLTRGSVSKEQLQRDVQLARQSAHQDMLGEMISDEDLAPFEG